MENKLDYITIKGFRSIKAVEKLEIRPINVLVGANGSGKSNFLGVFSFLRAVRRGWLVEYAAQRGGADNILYFGAKTTQEIELQLSFQEGVNGYELRLARTDDDRFFVRQESCWFWNKAEHSSPYSLTLQGDAHEASISKPQQSPIPRYVQQRLDRCQLYHFHDTSDSSPMKSTADVNDNRLLRVNASNLAPYLFYLQERQQAAYQLIRKSVQRVAPFFDDFQLAPQRLNPNKIRLEWRHVDSDLYFDASALSDGTLRFMALATLLLQPTENRPAVILVDEPELGLHPYAIALLASMIKSASRHTQVIVSTQSPLLLDHFQPEDVLVTDRQEGESMFKRLEPSELAEWLDDYSLGQLWEKNQFGGRPGGV